MVQLLILINVAVFVAEIFAGDELLRSFALWPPVMSADGMRGEFMPWQPLTYAFLHANGAHLALNMLGLYMFGRDVERTVGTRRTWLLYLSSVLSAALAQVVCTILGVLPGGAGHWRFRRRIWVASRLRRPVSQSHDRSIDPTDPDARLGGGSALRGGRVDAWCERN